jgi:hypothetical protein
MQNSEELLTRLSKVILIPSGPLLVEMAAHNSRDLKRFQPCSQDVSRSARVERAIVEGVLVRRRAAVREGHGVSPSPSQPPLSPLPLPLPLPRDPSLDSGERRVRHGEAR